MKTAYLFDIDGTLTPPTQKMQGDFVYSFLDWSKSKDFFLVGGSSNNSLLRQLPSSISSRARGIFSSMGNELRIKNKLIYKREWKPSVELLSKLLEWHMKSPYQQKGKKYIDKRVGMINFSIAGRDSNENERKKYFEWDKINSERETIANDLSEEFPNLDIRIGGMISLDIQPKGFNKSQAVDWVRDSGMYNKIYYFGDKGFEGGNDYDAKININNNNDGKFFDVKDCNQTKKILESLQ